MGDSFATPFGVFDAGRHFFRGFAGVDALREQLDATVERESAGAELSAEILPAEGDEFILSIDVTSHMSITLGAELEPRLSFAVLENIRDPYFPITATHMELAALCGDLEPEGSIECAMPLGEMDLETLHASELFVTLSYRPDAERQSHDSVQAAFVDKAGLPEIKPTICENLYLPRLLWGME